MEFEAIDKTTVLDSIKNALTTFIEFDNDTINNNVHEQCISSRLAMYLRDYYRELEHKKIFVDVEYNRRKNEIKRADQNKPYDPKTNRHIRPDILIHKRLTDAYNLLYCEIKKNNNSDLSKVEYQVETQNYKFGIAITKISLETIIFDMFEKQGTIVVSQTYIFDCDKRTLTNEH